MISTLLTSATPNNTGMWIVLGVMLVLLVGMYIMSSIKRKKYNQETAAMLDSLKPGDKIKTYSGIYGEIVAIRETTDGKVVTLKLGDEDHVSYMSVDSGVIYCIDKKQDVVYDAEGNIIEPKDEEEETQESNEAASEDAQEETKEDEAQDKK